MLRVLGHSGVEEAEVAGMALVAADLSEDLRCSKWEAFDQVCEGAGDPVLVVKQTRDFGAMRSHRTPRAEAEVDNLALFVTQPDFSAMR